MIAVVSIAASRLGTVNGGLPQFVILRVAECLVWPSEYARKIVGYGVYDLFMFGPREADSGLC